MRAIRCWATCLHHRRPRLEAPTLQTRRVMQATRQCRRVLLVGSTSPTSYQHGTLASSNSELHCTLQPPSLAHCFRYPSTLWFVDLPRSCSRLSSANILTSPIDFNA